MNKLVLYVLTPLLLAGIGPSAPAADEPAAAGRPGIALKFDVSDEQATILVALNYMRDAKARPEFEGVRRYTYSIPVGTKPARVGWDKGNQLKSVILGGGKYVYTPAMVDRTENGSISVAPVNEPAGAYRIRGVYDYFGQLFVIDAAVKPGDPVLLYEGLDKEDAE